MLRIVLILALLAPMAYGRLSGGPPKFTSITNEASDIVIGLVSSVTYTEEQSSLSLFRERDWLHYEMKILPIRVLRGDMTVFNKDKPETDQEITVPFLGGSPFGSVGSPHVHFHPVAGLIYIVFLNKTDAGAYELSNVSYGFLPIYYGLIEGSDPDIWKLLIETVRYEEMPMYLHDQLFKVLNDLSLDKEQREQLLDVRIEYLTNYTVLCAEKLDATKKERVKQKNVAPAPDKIESSRDMLLELGD